MKTPAHPLLIGTVFVLHLIAATGIAPAAVAGCLPDQASFTAQVSDNGVQLSWTIPAGSSERGYRIERSNGHDVAEVIAEVEATLSCIERKRYTHLDRVPGTGLWFYRLVALSADGGATDLGVVAVPVDGPQGPFPAPAAIPSEVPAIAAQDRMDLRMVDARGRVAPR